LFVNTKLTMTRLVIGIYRPITVLYDTDTWGEQGMAKKRLLQRRQTIDEEEARTNCHRGLLLWTNSSAAGSRTLRILFKCH